MNSKREQKHVDYYAVVNDKVLAFLHSDIVSAAHSVRDMMVTEANSCSGCEDCISFDKHQLIAEPHGEKKVCIKDPLTYWSRPPNPARVFSTESDRSGNNKLLWSSSALLRDKLESFLANPTFEFTEYALTLRRLS